MASSLGVNIRTARRSAGFTQKDLAEHLEVESITVSRWERGVTSPSISRLRAIASLCETDPTVLIGREQNDLSEIRDLVQELHGQVAAIAQRLGIPS